MVKLSFFRRQFAVTRTKKQDNFDFAFGVVVPIACFLVDPVVFQGGFFGGGPVLGEFQYLAYLISAIEMAVLILWISFKRHLQSFTGPVAGVLILGGLFSFLIGVLILPYSLIGLLFILGIAGFVPFFTSFVYLRNGVRALRAHDMNSAYGHRFSTAVASGLIALALPVVVSQQHASAVDRKVEGMMSLDLVEAEAALNQGKWIPTIPKGKTNRLVFAYEGESNPARRAFLKRAYEQLTGEEIEQRLFVLRD